MEDCAQVMCKNYAILYKGLEHLWIWVSMGGPRTNLLWILRRSKCPTVSNSLWPHGLYVVHQAPWCWGNRVMIQESQSSTFWFQPIWGDMLVVSVHLTSSTCWGFGFSKTAQGYSPWGGTRGPRLCIMTKLLLFCRASLLSFASAFSHFSD